MGLRPYQQECLDSILREYMAGCRHQLCVLATGCGKTHIAAHLPEVFKAVLPGRLLFVAHREKFCSRLSRSSRMCTRLESGA